MIKIINTSDNSRTLFSEEFSEHYHSVNGAITESEHIFINLGLRNFKDRSLNILEVGYGTGLNAIITFKENNYLNNNIYYHGLDIFPINKDIFEQLDYSEIFNIPNDIISNFYEKWNEPVSLNEKFILYKENTDFEMFIPQINYDLIYFDAFSPETQPELWKYENLVKIIDKLNFGGLFVTYCCKGVLKQNLREIGMDVKRYPGPVGKRHVLCALKK